MKSSKVAKLLVAASLLNSAPPLLAQSTSPLPAETTNTDDMLSRFVKGMTVIVEAAQAAGGLQAIRSLSGLSYQLDIDVANDIQGYKAANIGTPLRDGFLTVSSRFDIAGARFSQSVKQDFDSGYDSGFANIWRKQVQFSTRDISQDYVRNENAPSPFGSGGAFMVSSRWLPPLVLQRALQNGRTVAWVGESDLNEETTDIVEYAFDDQTRFRIYVARSDKLIRRVETIAPDPVSADDVTVSLFSGTQKIGGLTFPTNVTSMRRGAINQKIVVRDVAVNPKFDDADFDPPAGYKQVTLPGPKVQANQVRGRVYEISGLAGGTYQVPFVVMADFVVAFEAPLGIGPTRQVIAEIKRIAGDKPIKYVVVSHFHSDHAGGVGAFVELGATILSSASNEKILQTYGSNNRPRVAGQEGPRPDVRIKFQAVPEKGMTLTDADGGKLEIVNFPQNSHVENMLALVDRQSGVFMGADHHIGAVAWNPTFAAAAKWIEKNRDIEMVTGVHDTPLSRSDLLGRASLARQ